LSEHANHCADYVDEFHILRNVQAIRGGVESLNFFAEQ
jgi:hypothetical protein